MKILVSSVISNILNACNNNPYSGDVVGKELIIASIELSKLCKEFADNGHMDEAMDIESDVWVEVIKEFEKVLLELEK